MSIYENFFLHARRVLAVSYLSSQLASFDLTSALEQYAARREIAILLGSSHRHQEGVRRSDVRS